MSTLPLRKKAATALLASALLFGSAMPAAAILQKGHAAPPLQGTTLSGERLSLATYRGQVLVVDFFATWCGPCKETIPHLISLKEKFGKQGAHILGLAVDDTPKALREFIAAKRINYPVAQSSEDLETEYGVRSLPTLFVINKKGIVAGRFQGVSEQTMRQVEELIKRSLAE